jgi:hypothetical protein
MGFVSAKEEDVAAHCFLWLTYQTDMKCSRSDRLAVDGVLEFLAVRFVGEDAKLEGRVFSALGADWPIYELREVEEKRSLYLVLIGGGLGSA